MQLDTKVIIFIHLTEQERVREIKIRFLVMLADINGILNGNLIYITKFNFLQK